MGLVLQVGREAIRLPPVLPHVPRRKVLQEVRTSSGGLVRTTVVENPGVKVSALLVESLPGEKETCVKQDCNPCKSANTRRHSCHRSSRRGMVYWCKCDNCQSELWSDNLQGPAV